MAIHCIACGEKIRHEAVCVPCHDEALADSYAQQDHQIADQAFVVLTAGRFQ